MGGRKKVKTKETGAAEKPRKERKSRRSAVEEETTVLMDETIWKELPDELLESVIARVPIATIFRFRLVCHKWNSLPFLQRWLPQELPLIYAVVWDDSIEGSGALYDPLVKKWYNSTLTHTLDPILDSEGGLVCYVNFRHSSFRVGNHLTQTWKVFPWPASLRVGAFAMAFVYNPSVAGGYKIVWVDWEGKYGVLDYSSLEEKTITEGRIPATFDLWMDSFMGREGLAIGSVVYFRCDKPDGIMSYDVVSGTWEQLLIVYPPKSHVVSLADGGGRLLLVGWVSYNNDNADGFRIRPCVCVWELDTQMRSWREVDRMPPSYCPVFENNYCVDAECLSTRRLLVISLSGWLLKKRMTRRAQEILVQEIFAYDVVSREWSKVPEWITPEGSCAQFYCGVGFIPCLSASP